MLPWSKTQGSINDEQIWRYQVTDILIEGYRLETAPKGRARVRDLGAGGLLIAGYLIVTRIGGLEAAKIGFQAGPLPLYLTDFLLIFLLLYCLFLRSGKTIVWLIGGRGIGIAGQSIWLLILASVFHTVAAFPAWGILAIRDLAIFSYALFFPLAYFILDTPAKAATLVRIMAYAGAGLAFLLVVDVFTGLHFYFEAGSRVLTDDRVQVASYASGDEGGMCAFAVCAMLAYLMTERRGRVWYFLLMLVAILGVALPQTRAATIGIAMAAAFALLLVGPGTRIISLMSAIGLLVLAYLFVTLLPETELARTIWAFYKAVTSGVSVSGDDNAYFRLLRWNAVLELWQGSPFIGIGFGKPIIPEFLIQRAERGLNAGLPHNSFLTTVARMGLIGLALLLTPWLTAIYRAARATSYSRYRPDAFAVAIVLVCMLGYANFVLFIERPMHAAALWIMAAAACRLSDRAVQ